VSRPGPQPAGGRAAAGAPRGIVLVLHGGQDEGTEPASAAQLAVLRMIPVARVVRRAAGPGGIEVRRPRFTVRGWNGASASPVAGLTGWLDQIAREHGPVPVVLIGHSMGGRAALRAAGHPLVTAVAGLAPWLPDGEPVAQLAGRRVLLVHSDVDRVTSPALTWAYAKRARAVTEVATAVVHHSDHAMLRRARTWHRLAAEFARDALSERP
jgi:pimeloyl-ACP methyl ester carboxylesterase